jgi:hypothetical protein
MSQYKYLKKGMLDKKLLGGGGYFTTLMVTQTVSNVRKIGEY